ncbi:MAG TPA: Stp1/IreP family PP2C-type Ser/Thr phosphatase [Solirubrobacteraceae bacterium]|nr:Stp1/IreP family PP2C-type Ser/Thr phosphatase [Solirubrobacteraceae bacterium]
MLRVAEHVERTDTGRQRRTNEDAYVARSPLFAIADGMGGAQAGEVASQTAAAVFARGLPAGRGSVEERLAGAVQEANEQIHGLSVSSDELAGMGTTLTAAYVGEHDVTIVHVGDSRGYRWRDGRLERLTSDHSLVEELVRQGRLEPSEAEDHPQRSIITRALGPEAVVHPDARTFPARAGDVFLLCSDGLTDMVGEAAIAEAFAQASSLQAAARELVDRANAAGGRDNITVVLFRLEEVQVAGGPARAEDPATQVGSAALRAEDVRRALAEAPPAAAAEAPRSVARREPVAPRPSAPPAGRRRRRRRVGMGWVVAACFLAILATGAYLASQTVYFVGSDADGFVSIYRGVPYALPAGLSLYHLDYVSGVSAAQLTPAQRRTITEHRLRSRRDSDDLVRQLELGTLSSR